MITDDELNVGVSNYRDVQAKNTMLKRQRRIGVPLDSPAGR
jgi:hypothetical protein